MLSLSLFLLVYALEKNSSRLSVAAINVTREEDDDLRLRTRNRQKALKYESNLENIMPRRVFVYIFLTDVWRLPIYPERGTKLKMKEKKRVASLVQRLNSSSMLKKRLQTSLSKRCCWKSEKS